jgi:hypothetical protein
MSYRTLLSAHGINLAKLRGCCDDNLILDDNPQAGPPLRL